MIWGWRGCWEGLGGGFAGVLGCGKGCERLWKSGSWVEGGVGCVSGLLGGRWIVFKLLFLS